jgi:hypothetical protein
MGDGRRQRGEKPQNYTHRGLTYYNRWRISPAGYIFIIPVSGATRLAAGAYRLINPHSFLRLSGLGFVLRFNSFLKIFAGNYRLAILSILTDLFFSAETISTISSGYSWSLDKSSNVTIVSSDPSGSQTTLF